MVEEEGSCGIEMDKDLDIRMAYICRLERKYRM